MISKPNTGQKVVRKIVGICGRYSTRSAPELRGGHDALVRLAEIVASDGTGEVWSLSLPTNANPSPYDDFVSGVQVIRSTGPVNLIVNDRVLRIEGSLEGLAKLADEIRWCAEDAESKGTQAIKPHSHIEYYPGHEFLAPSSEALVVTVDDECLRPT